jgi:tRNA(Phe) wybutosine-synthesizing methylase Tyw3
MEEKTTKVLIEIPAEFDKKLELSLAEKKAIYVRTTKAKEIVRLAQIGFNSIEEKLRSLDMPELETNNKD